MSEHCDETLVKTEKYRPAILRSQSSETNSTLTSSWTNNEGILISGDNDRNEINNDKDEKKCFCFNTNNGASGKWVKMKRVKVSVLFYIISIIVLLTMVAIILLSVILPSENWIGNGEGEGTKIDRSDKSAEEENDGKHHGDLLNPIKDWNWTLHYLIPKLQNCGHLDKSSVTKLNVKRRRVRVVGGDAVTNPNLYPWIGQLGYDFPGVKEPVYGCGASLISQRYVLTSAHCIYPKTPSVVKLRAEPEPFSIEEIHIHPNYSQASPRSRIFDLALIRLSKETKFYYPVCLPFLRHYGIKDFQEKFDSGIVAGYGLLSNESLKGSEIKASSTLHKVTMPLVPNEDCKRFYERQKEERIITKLQFCAGNEKGKDFCSGDSGTPFVVEDDGQFFQVGVASYGTTTCGLGHPSVFTNLTGQYRLWILDTIRP